MVRHKSWKDHSGNSVKDVFKNQIVEEEEITILQVRNEEGLSSAGNEDGVL